MLFHCPALIQCYSPVSYTHLDVYKRQDYVVYPEKEMAMRSAVKFSADNIFDYVSLSPEYSIYEVKVPGAWAVSYTQLDVYKRQNVCIAVEVRKCGI